MTVEAIRGQWRMSRHDASNAGRADISGSMRTAPVGRWSRATGGDLVGLADVVSDGRQLIVALAGTTLQCFDVDGVTRWSLPRLATTRLVAAGDLDGTGHGAILVRTGSRTLRLIDAASGAERWRWSSEADTNIHDHAGVLLVPLGRGQRLVVAPTYADHIIAFDLDDERAPRQRWQVTGPWDAGFGPSIVAADMDGDGQAELVLSSRMGSADRTSQRRTTSAQTVLGRRHGLLYQAVHDLDDGALRTEFTYAPHPGGYRCARPYGLLAAAPLGAGELPAVVLASCQVEEYMAVSRPTPDGSLERAWGQFIEKDWPVDESELRVSPDALGDIDGDGRAELVVSLWQDGHWQTRILDAAVGWNTPRAVLGDLVCWGVLRDRDERAVLIVSREAQRVTVAATELMLLDGRSLEVVARIDDASIVESPDAALPTNIAFMARRRAAAKVSLPGLGEAVVIRRHGGASGPSIAAWAMAAGRGVSVHLTRGDALRVDAVAGGAAVARSDGSIALLSFESRTAPTRRSILVRRRARMQAQGRVARVLVRAVRGHPELIVEHAGRRTGGGRVASRGFRDGWEIDAEMAAPIEVRGQQMLLVARHSRHGHELALLGESPASADLAWQTPLDAPLACPPLPIEGGRIVLTLRTGVHTQATEIRSDSGDLATRLEQGAYLHRPALLPADEARDLDRAIVLDDHGVLIAIDSEGQERWRRDWTAAYSLPITGPFLRDGGVGLLRASGIHGIELRDAAGRRRWRHERPLWSCAAGPAAVGWPVRGSAVMVQPRREGVLEAFSLPDGRTRWQLALGEDVEHASVTAGDVDGDGLDEFLVGLPDGRLLCIAEEATRPVERWSIDLGAGIGDAWLADVDGRGEAAIVAATTDGAVRILRAPRRARRVSSPPSDA